MGYFLQGVSQIHAALGAHIEEEVYDAEVGLEAGALLEHLVVPTRTEGGIGLCVRLGRDEGAQIGAGGGQGADVVGAYADAGRELQEGEYEGLEGGVEVDEIGVGMGIDGLKVVGIVLEVGAALVG